MVIPALGGPEMKLRQTARTLGAQSDKDADDGAISGIDGVIVLDKGHTMNKKHIFVSQVFMTFIMAASMSGLMGLLIAGPSMDWLASWPKQFIIAWPIAFILTMFAWPASMGMAGKLLASRRGGSPGTL